MYNNNAMKEAQKRDSAYKKITTITSVVNGQSTYTKLFFIPIITSDSEIQSNFHKSIDVELFQKSICSAFVHGEQATCKLMPYLMSQNEVLFLTPNDLWTITNNLSKNNYIRKWSERNDYEKSGFPFLTYLVGIIETNNEFSFNQMDAYKSKQAIHAALEFHSIIKKDWSVGKINDYSNALVEALIDLVTMVKDKIFKQDFFENDLNLIKYNISFDVNNENSFHFHISNNFNQTIVQLDKNRMGEEGINRITKAFNLGKNNFMNDAIN